MDSTIDETKLKSLQRVLDVFDQDRITSKEFIDAFQQVIAHVKTTQNLTLQHLQAITQASEAGRRATASENAAQIASMRAELASILDERGAELQKGHEDALSRLDEAVSSLKDGKDADEELIVARVLERIPPAAPPESVDDVREAVEELKEALEDHDKRITSTSQAVIGNTPGTGVATAAKGILGRYQNLYFPGATITTNNTDATIDLTGIVTPLFSYDSNTPAGFPQNGVTRIRQSFYNFLPNGGFDIWTKGTSVAPDTWTAAGGVSVQQSSTSTIGSYSAQLTFDSSNKGEFFNACGVSTLVDYTFSCYTNHLSGGGAARLVAQDANAPYTEYASVYLNSASGWQLSVLTVKPTGSGQMRFSIKSGNAGSSQWLVDEAMFQEGKGVASAFGYAPLDDTSNQQVFGNKYFGYTSTVNPNFPTNPAAGYVLTSDATGNATWQSPAAGSIATSFPSLPPKKSAFHFNAIDFQVITKYETWDFLSQAQRYAIIDEAVAAGANTISIAVPYDNLAKFTYWVTDIRTRAPGMRISFRSHWNWWQGDNGTGGVSSITLSGTTATVTTSVAHGLSTGDFASINGANQAAYNGEFPVTVTGTTTFTYVVTGSPASPATGTISMLWGRTTYLNKTVAFIAANASLFQPGDLFAMAVESINADSSGNLTFRTAGSFDLSKYKQFEISQVGMANTAFAAAGLSKQIYTWPIGTSVSYLNLQGQTLAGGSAGNSGGFTAQDILTYFGGVLSVDHYESYTITTGSAYYAALSSDLKAFKKAFSGCAYHQSETGYSTTASVTDANQLDVWSGIVKALLESDFVIGMNAWVNMASSTASLWTDNSGTIVAGGRAAVAALKRAFAPLGAYVESPPVGAVNGSNKAFQFSGQPKGVIADGGYYFEGAGYTFSWPTVTMDNEPNYSIKAIF